MLTIYLYSHNITFSPQNFKNKNYDVFLICNPHANTTFSVQRYHIFYGMIPTFILFNITVLTSKFNFFFKFFITHDYFFS